MSSTVPSQRSAAPPPASAREMAPLSAGGARFFHATATSAPDEAALATWWQRFRDPELDRWIEATLEQGYEVCAAALRLRYRCEIGAAASGACARPNGVDEAALYDYYAVRLRQIAITARHYFLALTLQERIACTDAAIAAEAGTIRRSHPHGDSDGAMTHAGDPRPAMLAHLHAHRIRLRAQWDAAAIALAHQTAQPLPVVITRLFDRLLPGACAEMPALGGPERVRLRCPELLAQHARKAEAGAHGLAARLAALAYEQREDGAMKQLELALATLAAAQAELVPVRAAAASAEAQYQRLRAGGEPRGIAEGARALHAFRDREIETRGRTYLALVDAFHAAGCGWPVLADAAAHADPWQADPSQAEPSRCDQPACMPSLSDHERSA